MTNENGKYNEIEGKIDLINLLKFVWKWKLLIITGTVAFILVSIITNFRSHKLYSSKMIVQPGIMNIADSGNILYIDDPRNIASIINYGLFQKNIKKKIKQTNPESNYVQNRIRATPRKRTNIVVVRYDASSAKEGQIILNILIDELSNYYANITNRLRDEHQKQINNLRRNIKISKIQEENIQNIFEQLQGRINKLIIEVHITKEKIEETNSLINIKNRAANINQIISLETLNYSLYQLINLKNDFNKQIDILENREIEVKNQLASLRENQYREVEQIEYLNKQIENINAIRIISSPKSNSIPIKTNMYLNITISTVTGFIATILLSLIIDFLILKKRKMITSSFKNK